MHDNQIIPGYQDWKSLGVHLDSWKFLLSEATRKEFEASKALNASWYKWLEGIRSRKLTQEFLRIAAYGGSVKLKLEMKQIL